MKDKSEHLIGFDIMESHYLEPRERYVLKWEILTINIQENYDNLIYLFDCFPGSNWIFIILLDNENGFPSCGGIGLLQTFCEM